MGIYYILVALISNHSMFPLCLRILGNGGENAHFDKEHNRIVFNTVLLNDGIKLYESVFHEFTHKIQLELCRHIDDYQPGTPEYDYLRRLSYEATNAQIAGKAFGHSCDGNMYVDPLQAYDRTMSDMDLIEAIYTMQMYERSAYQTGRTAREFVLSLHQNKEYATSYIDTQNEKRCNILSSLAMEFGHDTSIEELCKELDEAKHNIINGISPEFQNDTQALMMYDLVILLEAQNSKNPDLLTIRDKYNDARLPRAVDEALATFYEHENKVFARPGTNYRMKDRIYTNILYQQHPYPDANDLRALTKIQQEQNPKFIVAAIKTDRELAATEIKCMDVFKEWYHSDLNDLSNRDKQIVVEVLGDEFVFNLEPVVTKETDNEQIKTPSHITKTNNIEIRTEQYVFDGDVAVFGIQQTDDMKEELDVVERDF